MAGKPKIELKEMYDFIIFLCATPSNNSNTTAISPQFDVARNIHIKVNVWIPGN